MSSCFWCSSLCKIITPQMVCFSNTIFPHDYWAYKLYVREGGLMNNRKEFLWHHSEVQCPQQERGTACDFFVMRYIHDIIMLSQKNSTIIGKWVLVQGTIPKRKLKRYESFGDSFYFRMFLTREK
ncbi:uncharacterized protein LOC141664082 isoform X2 [Apium graveolens]|uniref:uncharacterized protein LOC141664082 isoform X2 n=1 Tax=Apium graveolens TaxID=4045 RepID=UPI003D7B3F12